MKFHRCGTLCLCFAAAIGLVAQTQQSATAQKAPAVNAPAPAKTEETAKISPVDPRTFKIGPEDVLAVQVWREPDFSRQVMVRPDGKISMPLIGEVAAEGLTPDQLTVSLIEQLSKYLNNPQVLVSVIGVNSKKYYITGEVMRPGAFPLAVPTRVLEALSQAGGFREFSNPKKIVILRKGERLKFNYKDVIKGKNMEENIFVENGDYIIVP